MRLWRVKTVLLLSSTKNTNRKKIRMTHQNENSQNNSAVQHILDHGLDGIGEAIRLLVDQAMKIERSHALQAQPHERTEKRQGSANGFKSKTVVPRTVVPGVVTFALFTDPAGNRLGLAEFGSYPK